MNERMRARMCVLASGSSGNCSVLEVRRGERRHVALIDMGLSPRRTTRLLGELGIDLGDVTDVLLTHLDSDHCHGGWPRREGFGATLRLHRRHLGWARRRGADVHRTEPFEGPFELFAGAMVTPLLADHDDLGTASFRIELPGLASLGVATDVGSVTGPLVDHLAGVDVLAIESNYCPRLQEESPRPAFLKRRIMGGAGHLSNEQCRRAVEMIAPREHVVFLHLSRDCNRPEIVGEMHAGADYSWTISSQHEPTRWVEICAGAPRSSPALAAPPPPPRPAQGGLFDGRVGA